MLVLPSTEKEDLKMWHLQSQIPRKTNVFFGNCVEGQKILTAICVAINSSKKQRKQFAEVS